MTRHYYTRIFNIFSSFYGLNCSGIFGGSSSNFAVCCSGIVMISSACMINPITKWSQNVNPRRKGSVSLQFLIFLLALHKIIIQGLNF